MQQIRSMPTAAARPLTDPAQPATLAAVGAQWLADRRTVVKASTYSKYESVWRLHLCPALGACRLGALTTAKIDGLRQALLAQGLAPKTVRDVLAVLSSVLAFGLQAGHSELVSVRVRYPRVPRRAIRVLTPQEQASLVAFLRRDMDTCKFGVLLALSTGIRLGELCALQWGHISLPERCITISATMQRLPAAGDGAAAHKTHIVISSPKTDAGMRVIPMSDTVLSLCRAVRGCAPDCYVLTGTKQYMEPRTVQTRLAGYTRACGLAGVHFHTLRHTFATRSIEVGFEIKSLSEILGHASTTVTLNRYVHASMELKRSNMNKLARVGL